MEPETSCRADRKELRKTDLLSELKLLLWLAPVLQPRWLKTRGIRIIHRDGKYLGERSEMKRKEWTTTEYDDT